MIHSRYDTPTDKWIPLCTATEEQHRISELEALTAQQALRIAEMEAQLEKTEKALVQALPWDEKAKAHTYSCSWVISRQYNTSHGPKPCDCWLSVAEEVKARRAASPVKHKVGCGYRGTLYTGECTCHAINPGDPHA